ncbi:hypothetical protein [Candidatus Ichthyocystis sparus]|uniref:hypothetical protein n=1 Tax=Candidatus Ichthyocystis sparus TaxID=1561004 RepID=UPI000B88A536|nr:hypothetical protein [Candidatus Ichthyocystis sparus]
MNINANVGTTPDTTIDPAQKPSNKELEELMAELAKIMSGNSDAKTGSTAGGVADSKNVGITSIVESDSSVNIAAAASQSMGLPAEPVVASDSNAISDLTLGFSNEQNFQALLAQVMSVLIESSAEESASNWNERALNSQEALQHSISASDHMLEGAKSAFVASMVASGVSMAAGLGSMGMSVKSMHSSTKAADLKSQASALQNPEMAGLATASGSNTVNAADAVAETGLGSVDATKKALLDKALLKEQEAQKLSLGADALGRTGMPLGNAISAVGQFQNAQFSAKQAKEEALGQVDQNEAGMAADWQSRMSEVRTHILQVLQEASRASTQSQSSAFRNT